jgi:integrase
MASIVKIGKRWRALVRKGGTTRCMTFDKRSSANAWAATIEGEIEQLKASGFLKPTGVTVGDLISRYDREFYRIKQWSPSKTRDLRTLKKAFGTDLISKLDHLRIVEVFTRMHQDGTGGVGVGARIGYLIKVFETAANHWRIAVPLDAARSARGALKAAEMITASKQRDRRVSDVEIAAIIAQLEKADTALPLRDVIHFCVATAMRIGEVCRLQWSDLNEADRTIKIRDRKHPTKKRGNDQVVPLLDFSGHDAFEIVTRQPRKHARIFTRHDTNEALNERTVGKYFIDAGTFLGIEPHVVLHDLRHEGVSRMFEKGYTIPEVSLVSGHQDWGNLRRYTNLRAVDLHRARVA